MAESSSHTSGSPFRAGVIGLGRIGAEFPDNHVKAYKECSATELVATCDLIKSAKYSDYMAMVLNEKLDIVSVCTPVETHRKIVCDIARHVRAIYCEKPIAETLEDADAMIEACGLCGTILQVNHQRRFSTPLFRFSRGVLNTGTHMFDLLRQYFGEIAAVSKGNVIFRDGRVVNIEEVDTQEPVFELDLCRNKEPMILRGVNHLVACLMTGCESISSGEEARETLRWVLEYAKLQTSDNR